MLRVAPLLLSRKQIFTQHHVLTGAQDFCTVLYIRKDIRTLTISVYKTCPCLNYSGTSYRQHVYIYIYIYICVCVECVQIIYIYNILNVTYLVSVRYLMKCGSERFVEGWHSAAVLMKASPPQKTWAKTANHWHVTVFPWTFLCERVFKTHRFILSSDEHRGSAEDTSGILIWSPSVRLRNDSW